MRGSKLGWKVAVLVLAALGLSPSAISGGLNTGPEGPGVCEITEMVDQNTAGSLRRAMEQGYNDTSAYNFCKEKIVFKAPGTIHLKQPIELNNPAAEGFVFEKDPGVEGAVILDASQIGEGGCGIILGTSQATIRGISIKNASGAGICIKSGSNGNIIEQVSVTRSGHGILVEGGSQNNLIKNGFFFDNPGSGAKLDDADSNQFTRNANYRNGTPVSSPASNLLATINSVAPQNSTQTTWILSGQIPSPVNRCEVFRGQPEAAGVNATNYISDITSFQSNSFVANIEARSGDEIFLVCIAQDGSTGPSTPLIRLDPTGGGGPGTGPRPCIAGQVFPDIADYDGDGIPDNKEDKPIGPGQGGNCVVDPGETDPTNPDTDGDGLGDGVEDRNKNGQLDALESDPTKPDTDGDGIPDGKEDANMNGLRDTGECDPTKVDTDGDGIPDNREDLNLDGVKDPNETSCYFTDTDFDGLSDGVEDTNKDGIHDVLRESDPRKADTDGDGLLDPNDLCPNNPSVNCKVPCIPGVEPDEEVDNDGDKVPDLWEDLNHDCFLDPGETDPFKKDTDGDGKNDRIDPCPNDPSPTCEAVCDPENINPFLDSDGDGLFNSEEDLDADCNVDPNESDPFNPDTDGDGILDGNDTCPLDDNPLCNSQCKPGIAPAEGLDSDGDGIEDRFEDINENCIQDVNETNFRKRDTDGDGKNDNVDPCPLNNDPACVKECIEGEFIPPGRDSDQDGIKDILEDLNKNCIFDQPLETDAYNPDSDGDGLSDGKEDLNLNGIWDDGETDPRNPDTDGDGILDGLEDKNKNGKVDFGEPDPRKVDSDGDGIPDGFEDKNRNGILDPGETDPAQADTDKDGLPDGQEDKNFNGIVDAGETDPTNPDTDGDGVSDGIEVNQGTNPLFASSDDLNRALGQTGCALQPMAVGDFGSFSALGMVVFALLSLRFRRK